MADLPELVKGQVLLVIAPHAAREGMLQLAAALSGRGSLRVLDGGNQFNAYQVARAARRQSAELDALMERIFLARAFTCYQMETLLLGTQAHAFPTLVLDFLSTFQDENVPMAERRRLLQHCARHLRRLAQAAPVVVSARPVLARLQGGPTLAGMASILPALSGTLPSRGSSLPARTYTPPPGGTPPSTRASTSPTRGSSLPARAGIPLGGVGEDEQLELLDMLRRCADQVAEWEAPAPPAQQPALF